jgi:hypothetical protein
MNRHQLRRLLVESRLRWVAAPVHTLAVAVELGMVQIAEGASRARHVPDLTAIIKTFERPRLLRRLVRSLQRHYPELPIVVADDSRHPTRLPGVETVVLPFDSGVSAGRQAALDSVKTGYTWNLDDDFVVYAGTDASMAVAALEAHSDLDLIGGVVIDLPHLRRNRAGQFGFSATGKAPGLPPGTVISPGLEVRDKVSNFFVARTEKLKIVGYTPVLKRLDHSDFFTRARGVITSAHCERFVALHAQTPFDRHYHSFRDAYREDQIELMARYRLPGHRDESVTDRPLR